MPLAPGGRPAGRGVGPPGAGARPMWAGGRLTWVPGNPLRVGDAARKVSRIESVTHKSGLMIEKE